MNKLTEELRSKGAYFIMLVVQWLNGIAALVGAVVLGFHEMYPNAVADFTATLPPHTKLALLVLWSGIVHFFLRQAKKTV